MGPWGPNEYWAPICAPPPPPHARRSGSVKCGSVVQGSHGVSGLRFLGRVLQTVSIRALIFWQGYAARSGGCLTPSIWGAMRPHMSFRVEQALSLGGPRFSRVRGPLLDVVCGAPAGRRAPLERHRRTAIVQDVRAAWRPYRLPEPSEGTPAVEWFWRSAPTAPKPPGRIAASA